MDHQATEELSFLSAAVPRSFLAWVPFLWSRVLFPGPPVLSYATTGRTPIPSLLQAPARVRRGGSWLLLVVVPGLLLYPCLSFLLFEPDEGRYAEIPREMLARGEWVVPYLQGEPYLDKPPLLYWLVMASYRWCGVHDWSARLVPALAVHGCILLTYGLGRRLVGERGAFWGALTLTLAPGFMSVGRLLVLDGLLALWVTLALLAGFAALEGQRLRWGWWLLAATACAGGILTKGPIALVLVILPLVACRWLSGLACCPGRKGWLAFAAAAGALSVPWYALACFRVPEFAGYFFWRHNVLRFLSPFDHQEPVWFYLPLVAVGLLPASLLAIPFIRFLGSGTPEAAQRRSAALGFLLLAGGWCVLFFSLSGSKLPTYILPAFPPLALAMGAYIGGSRWPSRRLSHAVAGLTFLTLVGAHYLVLPWYAHFHSPMSRADTMARYCADPATPVVCYPRNCDSVSFYLGRDDLRSYRSKEIAALLTFLQAQPRTVVLFTHRHSPESLRHALPPGLRLVGMIPVSKSWASILRVEECYMGIVEREG
jgi:4-amino-4-deoxy-L-arabinose transferase-like glycosyltransferase